MNLDPLLKVMVERGASDLFITAGVPPSLKINGRVHAVTRVPLSPEQTREMVLGTMEPHQKEDFLELHECNYALMRPGLGRFRASAFFQRNLVGMVLRRIETNIPKVSDLGLPPLLCELAMAKRGLLMLVGATGTGKSTSLAAMIGHRNEHSSGHIISIEDPIEYMHQHSGCIVTQREVGIDTESFEIALRNTLRQAPDVILIGEIRDRETMEYAITFAETGHLCLATLHANNSNQALDRIINFFSIDRRPQLLMDLSLNLRGIVSQRLIPSSDGGRVPAIEIMLSSPLVSDLIHKGEVHELKTIMAKSRDLGMCTFDQALFDLCANGRIAPETALRFADSQNGLRLMLKTLERRAPISDDDTPDENGLSIV